MLDPLVGISQKALTIGVTTICLYSWPAHRMGIYSNPLINGLIQHTFKVNFVFVEFPVMLGLFRFLKLVQIEEHIGNRWTTVSVDT